MEGEMRRMQDFNRDLRGETSSLRGGAPPTMVHCGEAIHQGWTFFYEHPGLKQPCRMRYKTAGVGGQQWSFSDKTH